MKDYLKELKNPIYQTVGEAAEEMGVVAYAVGGVVRDIFLNRNSNDIDIVVVGSGIELAQATAAKISPHLSVNVYRNFGTAQFTHNGTMVEFVGARKESYSHDSRKPIVEDGTLQDDQNRRDFTINALAIALNGPDKGCIIDSFHGVDDIHNKLIRTPLDPDITSPTTHCVCSAPSASLRNSTLPSFPKPTRPSCATPPASKSSHRNASPKR